MTVKEFADWLNRYKAAWEQRDPAAAAELFSEDASYFETPFSRPFSGREQIKEYWSEVPQHQENIQFSCEILAVTGFTGIARWKASFTRIDSQQPVMLDGILQATMATPELCRRFLEWWHRQEGDSAGHF